MIERKANPGRIKLTMKTARELAKRELGTAAGLEVEPSTMKGYYRMTLGNLVVRIHPDWSGDSGCIVMTANWAGGMHDTIQLFDPETLEKDFAAEERRRAKGKQERLEEWVGSYGMDHCCQKIKEAWENMK